MKRIRVLIVDDSALMREVLRDILSKHADIEVVATASDPIRAEELLRTHPVDVMTLDIEMPRMNGLDFLENVMRGPRPVPVVMVSTLTAQRSTAALRALELGAVDVVEKPKLDVRVGTFALADELVAKVRAAARSRPHAPASAAASRSRALTFAGTRAANRVIAIGASTGGTEALVQVLSSLPANCPGVVIVQHLPVQFSIGFAERLDRASKLAVRVAKDGDVVTCGEALLAPGDRHLRFERQGRGLVARLGTDGPIGGHRPSVDALFFSVGEAAGANAIAVLLTGMGADGADGMVAMRRAGAVTFAQDEATCVVFGMPREAIARGGAQHVLPLPMIASAALRAAT